MITAHDQPEAPSAGGSFAPRKSPKSKDRAAKPVSEKKNSEAVAAASELEAEVNVQVNAALERSTPRKGEVQFACYEATVSVAVTDLEINPASDEIYGTDVPAALLTSIEEEGIQAPILVSRVSGHVISGNTRLRIAKQLRHERVPVVYLNQPMSAEEELLAVMHHNIARTKTREVQVREYREFQRLEMELSKQRRRQRSGSGSSVPNLEPSKSRDKAAKRVGQSASSLDTGLKVVETIERLDGEGRFSEASQLRHVLEEKGFSPALNKAKAANWFVEKDSSKPKRRVAADLPVEHESSKAAIRNPSEIGEKLMSASNVTDAHALREPTKEDDLESNTHPHEEVSESELIQIHQQIDEVVRFLEGDHPQKMSTSQRNELGIQLGRIHRAALLGNIQISVL